MGEIINCRPKRKKRGCNKRLVKKRMDRKRLDFIVKRIQDNEGEKTVVIKKISPFAKLLEVTSDGIYRIVRLCGWIVLCVLVTVGCNTLLNGELREPALAMFRRLIGG
ncbi:hypothetical protein [Konateibacter massiliensis]|uniref:hypothetical protein n=1 Tax=Konateibacter massiliensis TaxID=2002841 RepID=UPI000C14EB90|nr:hypothetical protein [Konateibacter massiliensis]